MWLNLAVKVTIYMAPAYRKRQVLTRGNLQKCLLYNQLLGAWRETIESFACKSYMQSGLS
jgi:hypothetical protein